MITQRYECACDVAGCGQTAPAGEWTLIPGGALAYPEVPEGWLSIGSQWICPAHTVVTTIDGAVFSDRPGVPRRRRTGRFTTLG